MTVAVMMITAIVVTVIAVRALMMLMLMVMVVMMPPTGMVMTIIADLCRTASLPKLPCPIFAQDPPLKVWAPLRCYSSIP